MAVPGYESVDGPGDPTRRWVQCQPSGYTPDATSGDKGSSDGRVTAGGCVRVETLRTFASGRYGRVEDPRIVTTVGGSPEPPCSGLHLALREPQLVQVEGLPRLHTDLDGKPFLYPECCPLTESAIAVKH